MSNIIDINFGCNIKVPPDYKIQWFECDEMYHWVNESRGDTSVSFCNRFDALRSAWEDCKCWLSITIKEN